MINLFAQPYDLSATGFYFETAAEFGEKSAAARNDYGQPVEEFELQFIDGEEIDAKLFEALAVNQANVGDYLEACDDWDEDDKIKIIIAVGEAGYRFDLGRDSPGKFDVDLYECDSLRDLAIQFVDEGLFGDIPEAIQNYLDYEAIAHDLGMDYAEITIAGMHYIYRCD